MPETPYQPIEDAPERGAVQPCIERMELMRDYLGTRVPGTLIDIGCHTGWFCRRFALLGWRTIGVDRSPDWIHEAERQNEYVPPTFQRPIYRCEDLFALKQFASVDVALCLSVAMYLFDELARGWALMQRLSAAAPIMFMDFGGMYADRIPFNESYVLDEMLGRTLYTKGELLGRTALDRPFYVFTR